jgi:pimeloyl-ACP methyl ester carboxylesterase
MKEKFIETNQGRIYYFVDEVSKESPWIVFLHGLSSNHTTWDDTLNFYTDAGYNIISVELRGHGLSDKTRKRSLYTIKNLKNDVVEIIKHEGLDKVIVVGYSYGGYIGMDLAINNPELVEDLVLISANHASQFLYHWFSFINPLVRWFANMIGWLFVWQTRKKYYYFNPNENAGYWKSTFSGYMTMPLSINYWMLSEVFRMDYRKSIHKIVCPTLILVGDGDNFITNKEVEDMNKNIINSKVIRIDAGHFVAAQYKTDTAEAIIEFLK